MELLQITSTIWQIPFAVGHVHLIQTPDGFCAVDTGVPGCAPTILDALASLGGSPQDLKRIVLTHSHIDHMGSAAALVRETGARVQAGVLDAPMIRGAAPELAPDYTDSERTLHEQVMAGLTGAPAPEYVTVDQELHEGDVLAGWGEPIHVIHVAGHTPGGIALHLPVSRVLFSGDLIATTEGRAILGPFNVDRTEAIASFRRLAALDVETVCVPHGDPLLKEAGKILRAATPETDWL